MNLNLGLSDAWQSFLMAVIRFWDNRFQPKRDELKEFLRLELDRERLEKQKFLNVIQEIAVPRSIVNEPEEEKEWKPMGVPHWRVRAQQLEEMKRAERKRMDSEVKDESIENLEEEVGIN